MMKIQCMGVLAAALAAVGMLPAETVGVKSPDGKNEIRVTTDGQLVYEVLRNGRVLTGPNAISLEVEGKGMLGVNAKALPGGTVKRMTGEIATPRYKKAKVSLDGNALHLAFEGGWAVDLAARNDGVAYRFATQMGGKIKVVSESAPLTFANGGQTVWAALNNGAGENDPLQCSWEGVYQQYAVKDAPTDAKKNIWYAPITFLYDGAAMSVMESDICSYPGWNFVRDAAKDNVINGLFAKYPKKTVFWEWGKTGYTETPTRYQRVQSREDYLAVTDGTRTFPWRVFLLADDVAKLAEADIVYALASDNRIGDTSWIKPGKVAWDWWNCWNVVGVEFRAGCNTKTYEYFIDFAQKTGVEYIIFDEGWSKHLQIFEYNPEVDVPHLVKYAEERGVGIILWAAWAQFLGREEQVASHYAKLGVKGFKIDFMDRDDQAMVDFLARMAMVAAKYRLVVDYHGMYKPSGFQRTYPNTLNFEGVHGLENCKWGAQTTYMPDKDCTLVFTRMLSGPMDYTPGAMRNGLKSDWKPTPKTPGSPGTRVHQMALMSLFEAPLQMLCDSPSQYLANRECFDFMSKVPTVWDDTVALGGEMDRYAALARRKGDVWYLSAIAGWCGRDASFDTSFLGAGEWMAEIFADGVNADRDATDYRHFTTTVKAGEKLSAKIMPGGGFTARFTRVAGVTGTRTQPLLVAGSGRAALVAPDGNVVWDAKNCGNIHRVWLRGDWVYYSNSDLLRVNVKTGARELIYKPCPRDGLFGFEILPNGNIVIAENGTEYITELAADSTNVVVRFKGDPRTPDGKIPPLHGRYRMIRKTPAGTYLVCCSSANRVHEYDATGRLVWEQSTPILPSGHAPLAFDVLRRANGNTIISHLGGVTEFTPDHKAVWSFTCADFPELKLDNLCGLQEMPNGNLVLGTYANGRPDGSRVTAFEITRDKKIVWTYSATGDKNMMTAFLVDGSAFAR